MREWKPYERNRERKLRGEWLDDGEWFALMDAAKALRDHRIMQLRASPPPSGYADRTMIEHHALTIAGGPYGPLGGTHVFPRSDGLGVLLAGLVEGAPGCAFRNVSVDPGGYYRGDGEIVAASVVARRVGKIEENQNME